jgi:hypothetical protein
VATEILEVNEWTADSAISEAFKKMPVLQSEDIADSVLYALSTPPQVQVLNFTYHFPLTNITVSSGARIDHQACWRSSLNNCKM